MAKKEVIYQGLSDLNVLIDDATQYSPDYFRVTNLPGEFGAGINVFKFKGNPALFPENSPLYIEVLDANGLPIYYEIGIDLESLEQSAIISVYINEDTVPGNGSITICGQANQSADGQILDASEINVRWTTPVYIDISKRNVDEIIFDELPEVFITATTGSYTNLQYGKDVLYPTKESIEAWYDTPYIYRNGEAILYTSSFSNPGFPEGATNTTLTILYGDIIDDNQRTNDEINTLTPFTSSISTYSGSGIAYLTDPIIFPVNNSAEQHIVQSGLIGYMDVTYQRPVKPGSGIPTENTHNIAVVQFSGLQPQVGEVAKIRSYYKSAGVQEYIFSNETDISDLADEFGFTANIVTASFALPTIHRNDRFDFKFEFINPSGYVSKQVLEYRDVLFQGGNTYIGGEDNLITGSLYVAGATGTGVHISGKGSAAMIRSIGYEGFAKASAPGGKGGFVIYSGSVQPLLNASEQYAGVGIELFANTSSYFKYTTSGSGLLDIRTSQFFLGSNSQFISGANGNIEISSSNFHLSANGSVNMTGNVNITSGTGFATPAFVTSSIGTATSSLSSSINSTISSVSSSLNSSITSVSSSISSSLSLVSSSLNSTITSVSSSLNSSISSVSSSAAIALDRIVTDANNKIVKPNDTPNAGAGLYLSQGYLGYYSGSAWNAYVSSSGEFLFKKDNNNQMSFGNNAFVLKVSDAATISGSNINLLTPNFFLGSNAQYISGSGGNIEISSSNFHLSPTGDVEMAGDVNAVNGIFQDALITGFVVTGSGTAYEQASGLSSAFLLESWFTSSFVRNRASGNSTAALETKFFTDHTFNYGIFGWTASVNLVNSFTGSSNPLGYGYNVAAATYTGGGIGMASAGGWESTFVNPGPPPGFLKWKEASAFSYTEDFGDEYNGYGNEITASFLGSNTGKVCPTVDTIVFTSPTVSSYTPFSITSSLIRIPSASLGYAYDPIVGFAKTNTDPIALQFAMRMQSGSEGAGGTGPKWAATATYKTFWVQCEILDDANNILLTDRRYVYGADDWQVFNIPLTPALAETISGTITINNPFRIVISWMHSDLTDTGGRPLYTTITNLVRITELRLVQLPVTLGLKTDSLQFADSFFTSGNSGTQHFGSIYPTTNNTYDLGIDTNQWKTIKSLTGSLSKLALSDGIINPKTDVGFVNEPDSLVVYDGTSHLSPTHVPEYNNAALVVNYDGDTSLANNVAVNAYTGYQYSTYNGSSVIGFTAGNLFVSGTLEYSHPMGSRINQFNGEVTQIGRNQGVNPGGDVGDIYFLKYQQGGSGPGPAFLAAKWERASANAISGSGMLAIGKFGGGSIISGMGLRGIARFTGSGYDSLTSASGVFPGDKLYLSTTPGKFQTWAPTGSGEIIRIIGYCFNDGATYSYITGSALYFAPETSWIENV